MGEWRYNSTHSEHLDYENVDTRSRSFYLNPCTFQQEVSVGSTLGIDTLRKTEVRLQNPIPHSPHP
jgi:hypothetical protein